MNVLTLILQLICGAVGGNVAGRAIKKIDLGPLWNSIAGILGGGLGGQLLNQLGFGAVAQGGALELATILSNVASGGLGGGILMAIVGLIKSNLNAAKK